MGGYGSVVIEDRENETQEVQIESSEFIVGERIVEGATVGVVEVATRFTLALAFKRIVDITIALVMLTFFAPLMLALALMIKLGSHGPILYNSKRVGKNGELFQCLKFRTMLVDAEDLKESIAHLNERDGVFFKISEDPRITTVGRVIRKYSLDELPQLINVLQGEMSLVGPRPPLPDEFESYTPTQARRLDVTPGLTGLWQVSARQDPSFEKCVKFDLEYIDNWSLWLDFEILIRTIPTVLKGTGR